MAEQNITMPDPNQSSSLRAREIFCAARVLPAGPERDAFLEHACSGDDALRRDVVSLLLLSGRQDAFMSAPACAAPLSAPSSLPATEKPGDRIGRYRLREKIGEGGCGVVYVAEQEEPVRRRVALKIIKPGMDSRQVIARFEAERQALALMDHPNIARIFDGGVTEETTEARREKPEADRNEDAPSSSPASSLVPHTSRPYFVMELVRGIPITEYCDQARLSICERLDLFTTVCQAVQHAHQKGIIHRDLKPSNILVTVLDGVPVPKVIDFGIAKATENRLTDLSIYTELHQFIGTPDYMSPEQAGLCGLDIDTRSDIYSLGVLLYQLLTGRPPFDARELAAAGVEQMLRAIREQDPPTPSARLTTLAREDLAALARLHSAEAPKLVNLLRGDLDWIVMKCLEKDRQRRYETASDLAADIQRHLHNEPINARPPGKLYHFHKLVRRNKLIFSAVAAVVMALLMGVLASGWQAVRATRAEREQRSLREQAVASRQKAEIAQAAALLEARRAEVSALEVKRTLAAADFSQAVRLGAAGNRSDALAYLIRSLSANPTYEAALTRLATLLTEHAWRVPAFAFPHGHSVNLAQFSPDGRRVVTASSDRTARVWDAQTGQPLTKPLPHDELVFAAQFSPDGQWIVTASGTGMAWADSMASGDPNEALSGAARVWNAWTGQPLTIPLQHTGDVNAAEFSPDGRRIVTASSDKTARVWDAQNGKPLTGPLQHSRWVRSAQFSPDGKWIVTASGDRWSPQSGTAQVWDAATGQPLAKPMEHGGEVNSARFSADGARIVTASHDRTARVWDARTGEPLVEPLRHQGQVYSARFSPDGRWVVTASADSTARVWDVQTGQPLTEPLRHQGLLRSARFSPDGQRIVTASFDHTARVWDARTGEPLTEPLQHSRWVRSAQFSPDGARILTASGDGTAQLWDKLGAPPLAEPLRHGGALLSAQFSSDGSRIVTASTNSTARVWNSRNGRPQGGPLAHNAKLESAQFSADGKRIVTASWDTTARIWDALTGRLLAEVSHPAGVVHWAQFSPDGTRIVTASADTTARVWDAQTGQPVTEPLPHQGWVRFAAFSPDGKRVVTASGDSRARIWDARTGRLLTEPLKHERWLRCARFSPDGTRVATASADGTARVWDAQTGRPLTEPLKHDHIARSVEFSADGRRIVTASWDSTARVWDAQTGDPLTEPLNHNGAVRAAQFSPDGRRIVTASADSMVRVWDAQSGQPLTRPLTHDADVVSAQFSPDGKRIVTASVDGVAHVWDVVSASPRCPDWLLRLTEAISGQVLNNQGVLEETKLNRAGVIREVREQLSRVSRERGDDDCVIWGRWFLADPSTRTISPYSTLTVPDYIENRILENTPDSLAEAEQLAAGNAVLLERIARLRAALRP